MSEPPVGAVAPGFEPIPAEEPLRPITGGAVMSGASRVVVAATGALATIFVARQLGPTGAGGYAIAVFLIAVLTIATTLGIEHGIAYYVSSGRWAARDAYRSAQRVALLTGVLGAAAGVGARLIVPSAFGNLSVATTAAAAAALPFALSWLYGTYVALSSSHYEAYVLPPAVQSVCALVLICVLGVLYGLAGAVIGFTLGHVITAALSRIGMGRLLAGEAPGSGERGQLRRAIRFGIKGYASNALGILNYRLDLFVLAAAATAADVGHYSVAVAVTGVMWLLPQALADVLFPRIAALSALDQHHTRAFIETKSLRHTVLIVLVSGVVVALALVLLVVPVYGAAFQPSVDLGLILLPGVALLALAGTMSSTIVGRGRPGYGLAIAVVVTPITVALYFTLIPALDATGAALASTISYTVSFAMACYFYRRVTRERIIHRFAPTRSEIDDYRALVPAVRAWGRDRVTRLRARGGGT